MKCPHCSVHFYPNWNLKSLPSIVYGKRWFARVASCASCSKEIVDLTISPQNEDTNPSLVFIIPHDYWMTVYPRNAIRGTIPVEVPIYIAEDYREASEILSISPKASAALSRRCLQTVLREKGYKAKDLYQEIEKLLNETDASKAIPESLRTTIDGIRHFGNFSAHPVTDITTLQVIPVEPHEAEWCLDILDEVFEHFYVRPERARARKAELDAKLKAAGKHPSK